MATAFNELPLALFTALASIGAGAFIALAVAFFTTKFSDDELKRIDKFTLVPAAVVIIGFIAAFFHLANPLAAIGVFGGIGRSPMSNELCVAVIFAIVMIVYVIMGLMGKLGGARKGLSAVLAVLAAAFAVFMGLAYSISTIPLWSSPWPVLQMLGYALLGGTAMGVCVISLAKALPTAINGSFKTGSIALAVIGLVLALAGLGMMASSAGSMGNAVVAGAELLADATMYLALSVICLVLACVLTFFAVRNGTSAGLAVGAVVLAVVGVLAGRFVFYALQLSVGLLFM